MDDFERLRDRAERAENTGDPADVAHGFGPNDVLLDVFEDLWNQDDPLTVILRCEQADQDEGWPLGTSLKLYIAHVTNTH